MKKLLLAILVLGLFQAGMTQQKFYATSGGEMIFSFASIDNNGLSGDNVMRWSPVFNVQFFGNYDFSKHAGLIFGASVRNVGFIENDPIPDSSGLKIKYRNYNFGIPVGVKLGNLDRFFFYGGYEIEFPFHYKEKTFVDGDKQDSKISVWFTKRTPALYHSVFAGIQLPYGLNVKFKYYFTNFFNEDYSEIVNGKEVFPYKGKNANIFYFSLSFDLFKNYTLEIPGERRTGSDIY